MSLSKSEKEKILKALEEDREFRYAIMGLLGYSELLERFARLEERQQRLEEKFAELEERFARIEERFAKLEERQQRLEEKFARIEERQQRLEREMEETKRVLAVIAHRFGILSESGLRDALKYVVEEVLGAATVERRVLDDNEGIVYGHPAKVEIDVVVRDSEHIIVEVKSRVSRGDVAEVYRIGLLYERVTRVKPRLLIIGGFIDRRALRIASMLGVEVRPVSEDLVF